MNYLSASALVGMICALSVPAQSIAAVSPAEAEKLGNELTCVGAERAGNDEGTIPAYTGKYLGEVPGWNPEPHSGAHPVDPYAGEKPRLVITASNVEQYKDKLSDGQLAMFEQYPDTFRMDIYPTHRDFRYPEFVCERAKWNALNANLIDGGYGIESIGHNPFPIPETAMEVLWNHQLPFRNYNLEIVRDIIAVQPDGVFSVGRSKNECLGLSNNPNETPYTKDGVSAMCRTEVILPTRERGNTSLNHEPYNYKADSRLAWSYNSGTRRVRLAPGYGYDQPMGGSNGAITIDDARLFNGSPDRYSWELIGKKEMYVPANGYRTDVAELSYDELLMPNHANPDYIRYELRRVWVLEATLKPNSRHLYSKRRLHLDEDTWHAVVADNYDGRGNLWKHSFINYYYHPDMSAWHAGSAFYHDLDSGVYVAHNMTNERREGPVINKGNMRTSEFTPDRLRAQGR